MEFDFTDSRAVPSAAITALGGKLLPYLDHIRRVIETEDHTAPEASLLAPLDDAAFARVEAVVEQVYSTALRYIFVIGIGGSSLGTKAIYDAMASARDQVPHSLPRLLFVETTDPDALAMMKKLIARATTAEEVLFIVISKSGATTETIFNAEVLLAAFAERFGRNAKRVVVISEEGSPLLAAAEYQQMHIVPVSRTIGGRFSVCTPVGMLPLALLGFSVRDMRAVADVAVQRSLQTDVLLNQAALLALTQYYFYQLDYRIHDTFVFAPPLESLGKWYRQLLGESIGKEVTGQPGVRVGYTPTVTVGSTDLHSVGQLYLGGPRQRLTTFVTVRENVHDSVCPTERAWEALVPELTGRSAADVMRAIATGTKAAYNQNDLPYLSISLPTISPESLIDYMQYHMVSVMMLGYLLGVNPFDQPHVEQYKTVTKQLLQA